MWGNTPSSIPVMNTTGNSRPLALCRVINVTTSVSSRLSTSVTRLIDSRNSSLRRYPSAVAQSSGPTDSGPSLSKSSAAETSSRRFSSRPIASMVRSDRTHSR